MIFAIISKFEPPRLHEDKYKRQIKGKPHPKILPEVQLFVCHWEGRPTPTFILQGCSSFSCHPSPPPQTRDGEDSRFLLPIVEAATLEEDEASARGRCLGNITSQHGEWCPARSFRRIRVYIRIDENRGEGYWRKWGYRRRHWQMTRSISIFLWYSEERLGTRTWYFYSFCNRKAGNNGKYRY